MANKKICILGTANLKHMTLISLYTEEFKKVGQEYDIIYIDKYHEEEKYDARKLFRYELNLNSEWPFYRKLLHYWSFKKYAIDVIKKEKYDFIIVWNEFTAFMFTDFLRHNYANRYCVNIRDQNFNWNPLAQLRYKQVMSKSCFSTISSERFKEVFPRSDYLFVHSYNKELISDLRSVDKKREIGKPIRLMFIGRMSYPESIYKTIEALGNDKRFEFKLIGAGCNSFQPFVEEHKFSNVFIHDSFDPKETSIFLEDADIIYSLNKENDVHSDTLLPIKMYYAIGKHIPILAYKSSYTFEYAKKCRMDIGITSADFDHLGDLIYSRYLELNQKEIDEGCNETMREIMNSHEKIKELIKKFIV